MWIVSKCYKCRHYLAFKTGSKTTKCRRCFKNLDCKKMIIGKVVESAREATEHIIALESKGKEIGFKSYK